MIRTLKPIGNEEWKKIIPDVFHQNMSVLIWTTSLCRPVNYKQFWWHIGHHIVILITRSFLRKIKDLLARWRIKELKSIPFFSYWGIKKFFKNMKTAKWTCNKSVLEIATLMLIHVCMQIVVPLWLENRKYHPSNPAGYCTYNCVCECALCVVHSTVHLCCCCLDIYLHTDARSRVFKACNVGVKYIY